MSGMVFFISCLDGESVLKIAVTIETVKIKKNSRYGKRNGVGKLMNIERWKLIDHPTMVPIKTPEKLDATTKMNAS